MATKKWVHSKKLTRKKRRLKKKVPKGPNGEKEKNALSAKRNDDQEKTKQGLGGKTRQSNR